MKFCILLVVSAFLICSCGPSITVVNYQPLTNAGTEKIAIVQTQNATMGTVGAHHDGVLAIEQYSWVVGSNLSITFPTVVTDVLRNEMSIAGYDVINMTTTMLTSAMEEGLSLSVGATIRSIDVQTYTALCGNKANATLEMQFDITDLATGTLLFTQAFQGTAVAEGGSDPIAGISMAAQNAIRAFLADDLAAATLAGSVLP